jgi:DnaJ-class molecular chaperone
MAISFADSISGLKAKINVQRRLACAGCEGSGRYGRCFAICATCNGSVISRE